MLEDGSLDEEEQTELFSLLQQITGQIRVADELENMACTIAFNEKPYPDISFTGKQFCFTGKFLFGSRKHCKEIVTSKGGKVADKMFEKTVDYLIVGSVASRDWRHSTHGRKIEEAIEFREKYNQPVILPESHFVKFVYS